MKRKCNPHTKLPTLTQQLLLCIFLSFSFLLTCNMQPQKSQEEVVQLDRTYRVLRASQCNIFFKKLCILQSELSLSSNNKGYMKNISMLFFLSWVKISGPRESTLNPEQGHITDYFNFIAHQALTALRTGFTEMQEFYHVWIPF